jgi:two-component system LytT family response regulator
MPSLVISAIIVDDESLARAMLRSMLSEHRDISIVAECATGHAAVKSIATHAPDLVFLDIQMPELDGFGVLRKLDRARMPHIVFVTAFDQYALQAFEFHALDYLLKPFDKERFEQALERARCQVLHQRRADVDERILALLAERDRPAEYLDRIFVKSDGRVFFVKVTEIIWIEAQGNYVYLHTAKAKHLLRETLTALEARLDPRKFRRIQRSAMVNLDFISELQPWSRGDYRVILKDGSELKLNHRYRDGFQKYAGGSF